MRGVNMKKVLILIALLFVLAACSTKTIYPTQTEQTADGKAAVEGKVQYSGTAYETLLEQVKSDTITKNIKTEEVVVPLNFKIGKPGDTVVFGVNLNSVNQMLGTYFYRVSFIEARDKNSNPIETNREMVKNWLAESISSDTVLEMEKSLYFPVIFTIGKEIKSGIPTVSGQYTFEVQFYKRDSSGMEQKQDAMVKTIYLRVE
jgi:PBP1b-binding outer membrane lipoprotein LpoB